MNYNISKELFEAVIGFKVIEFYCKNKIQYYPSDKERVRCINWTPTLSGCEYNDFFFACIDFMKDNDIQYYLNIDNDIKNEIFDFLDNWLKVNKRQ